MKWYENGAEFEGTPAEYLELHGAGAGAEQQKRKPRVLINPIHGRSVRCTSSAGTRDFVNAKEAWKYVVEVTGVQLGYSSFCKLAADGQQIGGVTVQYTAPPRFCRSGELPFAEKPAVGA